MKTIADYIAEQEARDRAAGQRAPRLVVLLAGAPGSGKTTAARASGLDVYDRDDPQWNDDEDAFTSALARVGLDPHARAVVIRVAAAPSARARWSTLIRSTHAFVMPTPEDVCRANIVGRNRHDVASSLAYLPRWFRTFDAADGVRWFTGWDGIAGADSLGP